MNKKRFNLIIGTVVMGMAVSMPAQAQNKVEAPQATNYGEPVNEPFMAEMKPQTSSITRHSESSRGTSNSGTSKPELVDSVSPDNMDVKERALSGTVNPVGPQGWDGVGKPAVIPKGDNPKWYMANVPSTYNDDGSARKHVRKKIQKN